LSQEAIGGIWGSELMSDQGTTRFRLDIRGEHEILAPTPQQIKLAIDSISASDGSPFLILGTDGMTYMQAGLEENSLWTLEFQEGSLQQHFQVSNVSTEKVTDIFLAYAGGDEAWRTSVKWEHIDIE